MWYTLDGGDYICPGYLTLTQRQPAKPGQTTATALQVNLRHPHIYRVSTTAQLHTHDHFQGCRANSANSCPEITAVNKLCGWLEALPSRPVLHFPLTCVGLAVSVLRLHEVALLRWLEDVVLRGEAWLCVSRKNNLCNLLLCCIFLRFAPWGHKYDYSCMFSIMTEWFSGPLQSVNRQLFRLWQTRNL